MGFTDYSYLTIHSPMKYESFVTRVQVDRSPPRRNHHVLQSLWLDVSAFLPTADWQIIPLLHQEALNCLPVNTEPAQTLTNILSPGQRNGLLPQVCTCLGMQKGMETRVPQLKSAVWLQPFKRRLREIEGSIRGDSYHSNQCEAASTAF